MKKSTRRPAKAPKARAAGKISARAKASGLRAKAAARMSTRKSVAGSARPPLTGGMTVREAGRKGGLIGGKKGGETVKRERGVAFFQEIGRKGGQRVRDLIAAGKRATERPRRGRHA